MIKFRQTYSYLDMINQQINWDRYRDLLDISDLTIRQLLTERMLEGSIKTRDEIKQFKTQYLKTFHIRPKRGN